MRLRKLLGAVTGRTQSSRRNVESVPKGGAHYMEPDEDRNSVGYWRQFLDCSDGEIVCGTGATKAEAEREARKAKAEHETEISGSAQDQLRRLAAKDELCEIDMQRAIRLLIKLTLKKKES